MHPQHICPAVTPLTTNLELDLGAVEATWARLLDAGVDGVLVMGRIGEFHALPTPTKHRLIELAGSLLATETRLIIGTGSNSDAETIELSRLASRNDAAGVMVIAPYYLPLSEEDLFFHFSTIADVDELDSRPRPPS